MENSLNEHIQSEDKYPNNTMNYQNLVVSCKTIGGSKTCGPNKENQYDERLFISPLDADCEDQFAYAADGEIIGLTDKGKYTIDLLNLNSYELKEARKATFLSCQWCNEENIQWYLQLHNGKLQLYVDILKFFERKGYFSMSRMIF